MIHYKIKVVVAVLGCLVCRWVTLHASADSSGHHWRVRGFPVLYYTPETRWAAGVAGVSTFYARYPQDTLYPSSVGIGFIYTQEKQVLAYFPYNLYFKNARYWMYGETGYYQYYYYFYGFGQHPDTGYRESYGASFARVRLSALQRITGTHSYAGLKFAFDKIGITKTDSTDMLNINNVPGNRGGRVCGFGAVYSRDTRNHKFFPTQGSLAEVFVYGEDKFTGSTFRYLRFTFEGSAYFTLYKKHVLATHVNAVYINGTAPFTHVGMLGGYRRLRGYYEGRYRDNCMVVAQAEYRWMFWWRLGVAAFGGVGSVAHTPDKFALNQVHCAGGGGLRFMIDRKQRINLRMEYAWGRNSQGAYLTIGEAF